MPVQVASRELHRHLLAFSGATSLLYLPAMKRSAEEAFGTGAKADLCNTASENDASVIHAEDLGTALSWKGHLASPGGFLPSGALTSDGS